MYNGQFLTKYFQCFAVLYISQTPDLITTAGENKYRYELQLRQEK